jgi:hypothetical protein
MINLTVIFNIILGFVCLFAFKKILNLHALTTKEYLSTCNSLEKKSLKLEEQSIIKDESCCFWVPHFDASIRHSENSTMRNTNSECICKAYKTRKLSIYYGMKNPYFIAAQRNINNLKVIYDSVPPVKKSLGIYSNKRSIES